MFMVYHQFWSAPVSPLSQDSWFPQLPQWQCGYASIYWRRSHQNRTALFSVSWGFYLSANHEVMVGLIGWTGCSVFVCTVQRCLGAAGYRSRHLDRFPKLTPDHRHRRRRMLAHNHQNWNHQQQSLVVVADESILNIYNCGYARDFRRVIERQVECLPRKQMEFTGTMTGLVETDPRLIIEIQMRPFDDCSSVAACLPTCNASSDDQESVSGIGLDVLSDIQLLLNVLGPRIQRTGVQFAWSALPWSWTLRRNNFASWYGDGHSLL